MLPLRVVGETRRLAEEQDEYFAISIKDTVVKGFNFMLSRWELDPKEIAALKAGGELYCGFAMSDGNHMPAFCAKPNERELVAIDAGHHVSLYIPGVVHPPVLVGVIAAGTAVTRPEKDQVIMVVEELA